jgi:soyasaponin III rhamnosyltransferase
MDSIVKHENCKPLHVVMLPWLATGHMYPYFELAKILAQNGHTVTFISSPEIIDQIPKPPKTIQPFINLVKSPLPHIEQLQGGESTQNVPFNMLGYLKLAYDGLQDDITEILKTSKPDWVLYDYAEDWLPSIAKSLNIPCAHYNVVPTWNICLSNPPKDQINIDRCSPPKWVPFQTSIHYKPTL